MSHFDDGRVSNYSENPTLDEVIDARISRRGLIGGGIATAFAAASGIGTLLHARAGRRRGRTHAAAARLRRASPVSSADTVRRAATATRRGC